MNMNQRFWNGDKLIGISALIISLSTLGVFVYQTNLIRKQQYMAVYPHLNLTNYYSSSLNYKYVLENEGVGPAFLRSLRIKELNGTTYESLLEYLNHKIQDRDSIWIHYSDLYEGMLIQAEEEVVLFGLSDSEYQESKGRPENTVEGASKLWDFLNSDSLEVELMYESIYGEQWTITNHSNAPVKQE